MSYVLDALKKAERERRRQPEMGLDNLEQDDWIKPLEENGEPRSKNRLLVLCLGLALGIFTVILVVALKPNSSQEDTLTDYSSVEEIGSDLVPDTLELALPEVSEQVFSSSPPPQIESNPSLSELIEGFRFEGSLVIEGNLEASRVFIDGQTYFVGDTLKDDVYISDISPDSVSLSNAYEQLIHPLR